MKEKISNKRTIQKMYDRREAERHRNLKIEGKIEEKEERITKLKVEISKLEMKRTDIGGINGQVALMESFNADLIGTDECDAVVLFVNGKWYRPFYKDDDYYKVVLREVR